VLDKDHLLCAIAFSEVCQVQEGGLSEALDGDVAEPDEELLSLLIEEAREVPAALRPVKAYS